MSDVAKAPCRAEIRTVCENRSPMTGAKELFLARKRVLRSSRARGSFVPYFVTVRDACNTYRACFVTIFQRLGSVKRANIVTIIDFKRAPALALTASAILVPGTTFQNMTHSRNCFAWRLLTLERVWKSVVSISFTKWTSNALLTSGMIVDAASTVESGSMICIHGWEGRRKERIK